VNTTKKHDAREEPTYLQDFVLTEEMVELIQRFQTMENKITIGLEIDGIWNLKPLLDVSGGLLFELFSLSYFLIKNVAFWF
jgi:hypothetical protein